MMGQGLWTSALVQALLFAPAVFDISDRDGGVPDCCDDDVQDTSGQGSHSINGRRHTGVAQAKREAKKARNRAAQRRYR